MEEGVEEGAEEPVRTSSVTPEVRSYNDEALGPREIQVLASGLLAQGQAGNELASDLNPKLPQD